MTLTQFINKYLGKQVEYHSYNPNAKFQCVDLANQFIVEVLKKTAVIGTDAKDFPAKINKDQFDILKNTAEFLPKAGDIVVWNGRVGGGAGHIAIVRDDKATLNTFNSVDQNWSKPLFVTLETHKYTNVTYFLRAKGAVMSDKVEVDKQTFEKLVSNSSRYDEFVSKGFETYQKVQTRFDELNSTIESQKAEIRALDASREQSRKDLKELVAELARLLDTRQEISEVLSAVTLAVQAEDALKDELTKIAKEREQNAQRVQDLTAEVAYWKALAEQGDVLAQIKLEDLLKEIVRRLTKIAR